MTSRDLAQLIAAHSRLILPNLGAFLHKDAADETFSASKVTFSPFLKYNDGKLEDYLSKTTGISKEESFKQVHALVSSINQQLESSGKYPIPGLGQLVRDNQGAISFVADTSVNTDTIEANFSGKISNSPPKDDGKTGEESMITGDNKASSYNSTPANRASSIKINVEADTSNPDSTAKSAIIEDNINKTDSEPEKQTQDKAENIGKLENEPVKGYFKMGKRSSGKKKSKLLLPALFVITSLVVIFIIALVIRHIALSPSYNYSDEDVTTENDYTPGISNMTTPKPKDKIDRAYDSLVGQIKKEESNPSSPEPSIEDKIEQEVIENYKAKDGEPTGKYYLIVGSYKNADNARNMASKLKDKGFKSSVVSRPDGISCVALGAYSSNGEAEKAKLAYEKQFPGIWILTVQ